MQTQTRWANQVLENNTTTNNNNNNEVIKNLPICSSGSYSHALGTLLRGTGGLSVLSGLHCSHPQLYDLHWHLSPSSSPNLHLLFLHVSRPEGPWAGVRHTLLCCSRSGADGIRGIQVPRSQPSRSLPFALSDSVSVYISSGEGCNSLCILDNNRTRLLSLMGRDVEGCEVQGISDAPAL